eukprot:2368301-Prymnesium_polylepis.1
MAAHPATRSAVDQAIVRMGPEALMAKPAAAAEMTSMTETSAMTRPTCGGGGRSGGAPAVRVRVEDSAEGEAEGSGGGGRR